MLTSTDVSSMTDKTLLILDSIDVDFNDEPTKVDIAVLPTVAPHNRGFEGWGHADLEAWFGRLNEVMP